MTLNCLWFSHTLQFYIQSYFLARYSLPQIKMYRIYSPSKYLFGADSLSHHPLTCIFCTIKVNGDSSCHSVLPEGTGEMHEFAIKEKKPIHL